MISQVLKCLIKLGVFNRFFVGGGESMNEELSFLLYTREEFEKAKHEYINTIKEFCGDAIRNIHVSFQGNKMYVTFESWCPFADRYLLKFCNEFGFLAPIVEMEEFAETCILHKWEFVKILEVE